MTISSRARYSLLTVVAATLQFAWHDNVSAQPDMAFTLASPSRSEVRARNLLDDIAAYLVLTLGYSEIDGKMGTWRIQQLRDLLDPRYFTKPTTSGAQTVELAFRRSASGNLEFYAYAQQTSQGQVHGNPDLAAVRTQATTLIAQLRSATTATGPAAYGYEVYNLSYLEADRAIAMLKSLGYTTVEYSSAAGETLTDKIYNTVMTGRWKFPVIVKVMDATKTSLMDPSPYPTPRAQGSSRRSGDSQAIHNLGGTFLHQMTSGEPQQRLLIVYDPNDPEPMQSLLNLLRQKLDTPARQIWIEALVIEINTDKKKDLGITLRALDSDYFISFDQNNDTDLPFQFLFDRNKFSDVLSFKTSLKALIESGDAEILSSPSVLVLDGRQAKIQVGQQVPVTKSVSTTAGFASGVEYIQTGIVLNLRPRISEDGGEITMQVETIVSAVNEVQNLAVPGGSGQQVLNAPRIDNRQVHSFVRVADNTPFIIGGLISTDKRERTVGVPILSQIPILGLPFKRKHTDSKKQEVIVVLTPHVVPVGEKNFSYVIPKDSDMFNSFGYQLFRNAYRLRDDDIFDLNFLYESNIFQSLLGQLEIRAAEEPGFNRTEPFVSLLKGSVPGEAIIVRRMLWEIAWKTGFGENIAPNRIIVFEDDVAAPDSSGFRTRFLHQLLNKRQAGKNTLVMRFDASNRGTARHPFVPPKASLTYEQISDPDVYVNRLMRGNRRQPNGLPSHWTALLSDVNPLGVRGATTLQVLQSVLVLKRILALNKTLPLTIKEFRVGRQIIFPTEQDLQQRYHIIDRDAARYFYEVIQYYPEFEKTFNRETQEITRLLGAR